MAVINGNNVLKRRLRMFKRNPHCFWCGVEVVLFGGGPNLATIDHLYSRLHPLRASKHASGHDRANVLHVLACTACNSERGTCDLAKRVFIPRLESRREFAELASAVTGQEVSIEYELIYGDAPPIQRTNKPTRRVKRSRHYVPPRRTICTIEEAIAWAREGQQSKPKPLPEYGWIDDRGELRARDWDEHVEMRQRGLLP